MNQIAQTWRVMERELPRMWKYRWLGAAVACSVAVVGAIGISLYKDRYQASAKVYVDTQTVLKPLMVGLAFQPDTDQQVKMLARTLITRPNVDRLAKSPVIGLPPFDPATYDRDLDELIGKIKFDPSGAANLFALSYRDSDPQRARRLVDGLVNLFMESGTVAKQRDSAEASHFIDEQITSYEAKLREAENRVKDFKLRNFGVTGVANQDYFARVSALSDQVAKLKVDLVAAEHSKEALSKELAAEDPLLPADPALSQAVPTPPTETEVRLESQRRQLDEVLRRYTEEHPDVVALRRIIGQLEQQKRRELDSAAVVKPRIGGAAATNPVFQRLRVARAEAEANIASLRSQLGLQEQRLEQARSTAGRVPQAEAELVQLTRDYDILRKNYEQLVSRREAASLGVKIDQTSSLAEFRVVEPPRVASTPVVPGRALLALLLFPVALLAGVAAAFVRSRTDNVLLGELDLFSITGRPVLGLVTMVVSPGMRATLKREQVVFGGALGSMALFFGGWIAWVTMVART